MLTPTIPGREHFLAENIASVKAQTLRRYEHLILLDSEARGCAATMNALADEAQADYLLPLADDDLILPRCLELLYRGAPNEIIYSPPLVWGEDGAQFCASPPNIPAVALIRTDLWRKLGGYDPAATQTEDLNFWRKAESRGVQFCRVSDDPTWVYRLGHGGNKSRQ